MTARDKVLDKIRKLMALADSPSENEAALAAERAAELMAMHQIEAAELATDAAVEFAVDVVDAVPVGRRRVPWLGILADGVAAMVGAKAWWNLRSRGGKQVAAVIQVAGTQSQIAAVSYLFAAFKRIVEELAQAAWERYKGAGGTRGARQYKTAFCAGASSRLNERMAAARTKAMREHMVNASPGALVHIDAVERAVAAAVDAADLQNGKRPTVSSPGAFMQGVAAGDQIPIDHHGAGLPAPARQLAAATGRNQ